MRAVGVLSALWGSSVLKRERDSGTGNQLHSCSYSVVVVDYTLQSNEAVI